MPSSGIIDLAIGMALASVVTELIARFFGLRGEYLLRGLRELLDGGKVVTVLTNEEEDYKTLTNFHLHQHRAERREFLPVSETLEQKIIAPNAKNVQSEALKLLSENERTPP